MTDVARAETPPAPLARRSPAALRRGSRGGSAAGRRRRATRLAARVTHVGRISNAALEADQFAAHGLAWMATYAESLRELAGWAGAAGGGRRLGEMERLILQIGFGEYLGAARRRHPDVAGRDRAAARRRPRRRRIAAFRTPGGGGG